MCKEAGGRQGERDKRPVKQGMPRVTHRKTSAKRQEAGREREIRDQ